MKRLDLAPGFAAALCLLRLLAEPRVFYAFLAAAAAHEAGHVMAIYLVGGKVTKLRLGMCDAKIETRGLGYRQEIFCALAGPGMSVLVCLALRKAYATCAAISLILGLFNAMPVYPLDGGRALRCALTRFCPKWANRIAVWAEWGTIGILGALALTFTFYWKLGMLPLTAVTLLAIKAFLRKRPCKLTRFGVQ